MHIISFYFLNGERRNQLKCFGIFLTLILPIIILNVLFPERKNQFFLLNLAIGALCWTYLEYHLHRFWTHTKTGRSKNGSLRRHIHHHKHPTEIRVTPSQRVLLLGISSILLILSIAWNNYFTVLAGFFIGFSYSFFSHWVLHQEWSGKIFPQLQRFHIHHHCKHPDKCFGFSTTLWDHVFRTVPPKYEVISKRIIRFYYGQQEDHQHINSL
jgi:4-hydroxysphinganine ceramide fatty acyl 2-hydroxylase